MSHGTVRIELLITAKSTWRMRAPPTRSVAAITLGCPSTTPHFPPLPGQPVSRPARPPRGGRPCAPLPPPACPLEQRPLARLTAARTPHGRPRAQRPPLARPAADAACGSVLTAAGRSRAPPRTPPTRPACGSVPTPIQALAGAAGRAAAPRPRPAPEPQTLRRPSGTALNQRGTRRPRRVTARACQRTEPFSVPRQRSGRGHPAGPPPPPQPLPGRPRLVPNALPHAHGSDAEGGAEGSGGAVGLASKYGIGGSHPLSLPRRACAAGCGAAGRKGGRGACGRLRGAQAVAGRVGGVRGGARERRPRSTRAAGGCPGRRLAAGRWACGRRAC
jgi:hypothetical protein